jgi:hypothetical protein
MIGRSGLDALMQIKTAFREESWARLLDHALHCGGRFALSCLATATQRIGGATLSAHKLLDRVAVPRILVAVSNS